MTPTTLRTIGESLYGSYWQTELARALGIDPRRVRQWLAEERRIPVGVEKDIADLCRARGKDLIRIAAMMKAAE